jgi:O-antigen ligase
LAVAGFVLFRFTTIPARSRVAGLAVIIAVVFFAASARYWEQMQTVLNPHEDYNTTTETGRVKIWERGMGYMASNPVLGVGAANFPVAEGTISPMAGRAEYGRGVRWGAAHNSFVQIGAELGVPGLVCFVGAIIAALLALRRAAGAALRVGRAALGVSRLAQSIMAALIGFTVGGLFLSLGYSDMLYTLLALAVGLTKVVTAELQAVPGGQVWRR